MDPKTRRTLWNCLNKIRNKGKSLVLTTHSMDETEALCTKIGIMVNGELKCIGSLQHLKSRYGDGYTLLVKIGLKNNLNEFIKFILKSFETSELKENRDGFLNFHLKSNSINTLSKIFSLIEENKLTYTIEYYGVSQTNIEQIFLNFASKQIDSKNRKVKNFKKLNKFKDVL
jgi:ABC-type multidrug transport system ATPase subunit